MVFTCYTNYGTPPNSTGAPCRSRPCHTHKVCTSERNWPSSWTCFCLGAPHSLWLQNQLWQLALSDVVVRGMWNARRGANSFGLFAIQKKSDRKFAFRAAVSSKPGSRLSIVLLRGKTEGCTNGRCDRSYRTEHGVGPVPEGWRCVSGTAGELKCEVGLPSPLALSAWADIFLSN
jgi:hypothetical protein